MKILLDLVRQHGPCDQGVRARQGTEKLVTIPGITHYGIYTTARVEATRLAIEWFDNYLKAGLN
ncbi:MAG: hypothetical protein DMG07_24760 [Acidobacteria bacterium]|nr:MAG: hypothetical protein DMG07_24760 [Acidobacteriota bacterium]